MITISSEPGYDTSLLSILPFTKPMNILELYVQQKQAQTLQNEEKHHHNIEDRIRELELCNRKLEFENYELNENFLEIQTILSSIL
jgi:hypothetical protein